MEPCCGIGWVGLLIIGALGNSMELWLPNEPFFMLFIFSMLCFMYHTYTIVSLVKPHCVILVSISINAALLFSWRTRPMTS